MLLGLLVIPNDCFLVRNQKVGSILSRGSLLASLHQADRLFGEKRNSRLSFPLLLAFGVVGSFHQKSSTSCLQMFLQKVVFFFCASLWAMNRLSVCHDNQLPITKAVKLSKAIKWWSKIVCCRISQCVSAHIRMGMNTRRNVLMWSFIREHFAVLCFISVFDLKAKRPLMTCFEHFSEGWFFTLAAAIVQQCCLIK